MWSPVPRVKGVGVSRACGGAWGIPICRKPVGHRAFPQAVAAISRYGTMCNRSGPVNVADRLTPFLTTGNRRRKGFVMTEATKTKEWVPQVTAPDPVPPASEPKIKTIAYASIDNGIKESSNAKRAASLIDSTHKTTELAEKNRVLAIRHALSAIQSLMDADKKVKTSDAIQTVAKACGDPRSQFTFKVGKPGQKREYTGFSINCGRDGSGETRYLRVNNTNYASLKKLDLPEHGDLGNAAWKEFCKQIFRKGVAVKPKGTPGQTKAPMTPDARLETIVKNCAMWIEQEPSDLESLIDQLRTKVPAELQRRKA